MNFNDNISMNELQYLGDLFWKKNKLQKKDFELIDEDYNKILWLYKDTYISTLENTKNAKLTKVLMNVDLYRKHFNKIERLESKDFRILYGFEVTDIFKKDKINSIGGNFYVFKGEKHGGSVKLEEKHTKILFEWDPEAIHWVQKCGADNNDLYYYIRTSPVMSYELFDRF